MYAPREPNVRMKHEELPGRTSHSLPGAGARISYRDSGSSVLKEIALGNKDPPEIAGSAQPCRTDATGGYAERPDQASCTIATIR